MGEVPGQFPLFQSIIIIIILVQQELTHICEDICLLSAQSALLTIMTSTEECVAISRMDSSGSPTAPVSPNGDFTLSNIIRVLRPLEDKYDALGTHLGIKLEDIKRIEGDYPKNARRFTETIGFWQNNARNPSWSVLANAVEKVGGHGGLVQKLRASETSSSEDTGYSSKGGDSPSSGSDIEYYDKVPGCSCDKPCSVYTVSAGR